MSKWCCHLPIFLSHRVSVSLINMYTLYIFKTINHEFAKYFGPIFCFHFYFIIDVDIQMLLIFIQISLLITSFLNSLMLENQEGF